MLLRRNRYNSEELLAQLDAGSPVGEGGKWHIQFICPNSDPDIDDFEVYFPSDVNEHTQSIVLLRDFLLHIGELDNLVQESCEREHRRGGYELLNFKLHIGYISLAKDTATVRYWGTVVNTEWDAKFTRFQCGRWEKVNF